MTLLQPIIGSYNSQIDELLCTSCSYKNESYSSFLNVSINVPDALENEGIESERFERKQYPLEGILEQHLKSETLGEENKWTCSQCQQNVRAVRNHKYEKVPDRLVIHLNRMRFDPVRRCHRILSIVLIDAYILDYKETSKAIDSCFLARIPAFIVHRRDRDRRPGPRVDGAGRSPRAHWKCLGRPLPSDNQKYQER